MNPSQKIPIEIEILRKVSHPNIIQYIDHIFEKDYILLITELHGTEWDPSNPELSESRNPGIKKEKKAVVNQEGKECSPLFRLTEEQEKQIRRRTACDLFECIDARTYINRPFKKKNSSIEGFIFAFRSTHS
jgi:serine/threonine protein kinase